MIRRGGVQTGVNHEQTLNELEVKAGGNSVIKVTSSHVLSDFVVCNPTTINTGDTVEVPTDYNAVMSGPITINGSLTINGRLTIV